MAAIQNALQLPTAEEIEAHRRRNLDQASASGKGGVETSPVRRAQMDNETEIVHIANLELHVHALTPKRAKALQDSIEDHWPCAIVYAACADPDGIGHDHEVTAAFWTAVLRKEDKDAETVTPEDVAREIGEVTRRQILEIEGKPAMGHSKRISDAVADSLWFIADQTPGLLRENVPDLIDDMTVPELIDLLRVIWYSVGGFPGCMADRFARP